MKEISEFIGHYRILTRLTSHLIGELYIVEHTFRPASPLLLLLWPSIELSRDGDRATFLQKSTGGILQPSHLSILDAGVEDQHPYIIVPRDAQTEGLLREHLRLMMPALRDASALHPDDPSAQTEEFLRLFIDPTIRDEPAAGFAAAPTANQQQSSDFSRTSFAATRRQKIVAGYQRLKLWQQIVLAIVILALVCWGSFALYIHIPAQTATITIVPVKKTLNQLYTISMSTEGVGSNTIQGRKISFTSPQRTQTVAATGKGHHDAVKASGDLVISQIHLDSGASNLIGPSTLTSLSGVSISTTKDVSVSEGGSVTQHAEADVAGSGGNIGAYDINFPVMIVNALTNASVGTGYATNPNPFSGGTDASDFTFVQQSDIDKVTSALSTQLTPDARTKVTQQVKSGERMADDIQCTPNSSSNHKANDQSGDVTVSLSMTCAALVYSEQALRQAAIAAYKADGLARFGRGYDVVGGMQMYPPVTSTSTVDSAQFAIQIDGIWTFQWTRQSRGDLLHLLAGKPQSDAMQLLGGREDIKNVSIAGNWFPGNALPANPDAINLVVARVDGLPV